jgi:hypothetical protein
MQGMRSRWRLLERADKPASSGPCELGTQMRLSLKHSLFGICAISALAAAIWVNSAQGQAYNRWGVFRERSLFGHPVDQRRCQIQEIGPNEIALDELLARVPTRVEAVSIYRFLVRRGQCAP